MNAAGCTRRTLLGAGLVAGLAGSVAPARAATLDDPTILRLTLQLEHVVALGYETALSGPAADDRLRPTLQRILDQERQHADALAAYLRDLRAPLPAPPRGPAALDAVVPALGRARTPAALLSALIDLERVAVYSYYLGAQQLYDQKLVQIATAVLGDESQHLVELRSAAGVDLLPSALETGAAERPATVR